MSVNYDTIAGYYDEIYVNTDIYDEECLKIVDISKQYNSSGNNHLLDIGCGSGYQTKNLSRYFSITGIDLSEEMLMKAKQNVPNGNFYKKDMFDFTLEEKYGIAINLYGSIGFAKDFDCMCRSLRCVWDCMERGGVYILTPWGTKETFSNVIMTSSGESELFKYCCMDNIKQTGRDKAIVEMHHLIGKDNYVKYHHYQQEVTLFSEAEYKSAIEQAGFHLLQRLSQEEFRMGAFICGKS